MEQSNLMCCRCALLRVIVVHDQTRVNDAWDPAQYGQDEAKEETRDAPGHQYRQRRKNDAEKIPQRFHVELFLLRFCRCMLRVES